MKAMATLIEKLVGWLKSEPEYRLQESHASKDLIYVIYYRLVQCTRGLRIRLTLGRCSGLLFCGRHVVIEHGYKISAGKGLILEDGIHVNALSGNGVVFGRNVTIKAGAIIVCSGVIKNKGVGLRVGDYSAIGTYSYIAAQGGIEIGSNVIIGPGVMIFSEDHIYADQKLPIRLQGETRGESHH
jgi:acetyltransferase-like isoleucine patch superfamily enzyme